MNVLILHGLGDDLSKARGTSVNHLRSFEKYAKEHSYIYIDLATPITTFLKEFPFDAIVIDGTFLCWRWVRPRELFQQLKEKFSWIAKSSAIKIAFPQDDYDHSRLLDEWLVEWNVDYAYSICKSNHAVLYPSFSAAAHKIGVAYTGYVDDDDADSTMKKPPRPIVERTIDVGYRARNLPAYYGRLGRLKGDLATLFCDAANGTNLLLDISTDPSKTLLGADWHKFLSNSKFTLGCESGSSILDEFGTVRDNVDCYLQEHPGAKFEEIANAVFPHQDGQYIFAMVSPRLFEAATFGSCQILVEGNYLPDMQPGRHYLQLKPDFSNISEVLEMVNDLDFAQGIVTRCLDDIVYSHKYRYSFRVGDVFKKFHELANLKRQPSQHASTPDFEKMAMLHAAVSESMKITSQVECQLRQEIAQVGVQINSFSELVSRGSIVQRLISRLRGRRR